MDNNKPYPYSITQLGNLTSLYNALNHYNLTGYNIHEYFQQDKRKTKQLYFLTDEKGVSLTGHWEYLELNAFIRGYGMAFKAVKAHDELLNWCHTLYAVLFTSNLLDHKEMDALQSAIKKAEEQ